MFKLCSCWTGAGAQWGRVDQMCLGLELSWHSEVAMQYPSFLTSLLASSQVMLYMVLSFPQCSAAAGEEVQSWL